MNHQPKFARCVAASVSRPDFMTPSTLPMGPCVAMSVMGLRFGISIFGWFFFFLLFWITSLQKKHTKMETATFFLPLRRGLFYSLQTFAKNSIKNCLGKPRVKSATAQKKPKRHKSIGRTRSWTEVWRIRTSRADHYTIRPFISTFLENLNSKALLACLHAWRKIFRAPQTPNISWIST